MDEKNKELSQEAVDALSGLPEKERAETQQIIDEIAGEKTPKDGEDKPAETDKPEETKEPKPKEGDETKETDGKNPEADKNKPEPRREVKLMPAYIHEIQKAQFEKREKELLAEIEKAKGAPTDTENKPVAGDQQKEIEAFAEKHNLSLELAEDLIKMTNKNNGQLPVEIAEKLKVVDEMRSSAVIAAEAAAFNSDFDKTIIPLIKAEYGESVPESTIDKIREELKAKAYTPEYAKVPYTILYKGEDQFRGLVAPERVGAEGGSEARQTIASTDESIDLTKPVSDEVLKTLTDAQFEEYEKNMASSEKNSR